MKEKEKKLIDDLNNNFNCNITKTEDDFEYYDGVNKKAIFEFKERNKVYRTHLLQIDKFFHLLMESEDKKKKAIFVHKDESGIYIYDLHLIKKYYTNPNNPAPVISKICSKQTEFSNNNKITKYFFRFHKSDCILILSPTLLIMN